MHRVLDTQPHLLISSFGALDGLPLSLCVELGRINFNSLAHGNLRWQCDDCSAPCTIDLLHAHADSIAIVVVTQELAVAKHFQPVRNPQTQSFDHDPSDV